MNLPRFDSTDALILVDVQNDFCPGGALPICEGDLVVPVLNHLIAAAQAGGAKIIASRDWHPANHLSFENRGGAWPVHCVQNTAGAEFHPGLQFPAETQIVSKGIDSEHDNYSVFDVTGLADQLRQHGIQRLWIGGLALEVCVLATVLGARQAGFEVHVVRDATRPVNRRPDDGHRALEEMQAAGAIIENGNP